MDCPIIFSIAHKSTCCVAVIVLLLIGGCASSPKSRIATASASRTEDTVVADSRHDPYRLPQNVCDINQPSYAAPTIDCIPRDCVCNPQAATGCDYGNDPLVELLPPEEWIDLPPSESDFEMTYWERIRHDHCHYYSSKNLTVLSLGFAAAAIMAHTHIDEGVHSHFQSSVRGASSRDWFDSFHAPKELGNGHYTIPVYVAACLTDELLDEFAPTRRLGEWGNRSLRTLAVGTPPMLAAQWFTGSSRPGEAGSQSRWRPFRDNNGASGHSFMGAVPFITAAKMADSILLKTALYAGSMLVPLSRVNDGNHYASQAFLGWWMAYIAATAVDSTERFDAVQFVPLTPSGHPGVSLYWEFPGGKRLERVPCGDFRPYQSN